MARPAAIRSVAGMTSEYSTTRTGRTGPAAAAPGPAPVISVRGLRMRYGPREALSGLSFAVLSGELFALLGPNGAGKTTIVEILEGYRRRTGGQVSVLGADPWRAGPAWRARIGIMLQETGPDPGLTVAECLHLYGGYYPDPWPARDLLELTGLAGQSGQRASQLSGGQRRQLDLALALTGRPRVLFLDEPTTGLDPAARRDAWAGLAALKEAGTTIILTTHYLEEAEQLADRVAVIRSGALVTEGTPASLAGRQAAAITFTLPAGVTAADLPEPARQAAVARDRTVTLPAAAPLPMLRILADWADRTGTDLGGLEVRRPTLEDAYLQLTGTPETQATS
jgi:ABC-2 type transport system ATP-binding protein